MLALKNVALLVLWRGRRHEGTFKWDRINSPWPALDTDHQDASMQING